jgi:hypothetical protein
MQGRLFHIFVGCKGIPFFHNPFLGDAKIGAINNQQAVIHHTFFFTVKVDLWQSGGSGGGMRMC